MNSLKMLYALILLIAAFLTGCSTNSNDILVEMEFKSLNKDTQSFIEGMSGSNGIFLYNTVNKDQFIIVSYAYVVQGEDAKYLDAISADITNRSLIINLEEMNTNQYDDDRLKTIRIFKITNTKEYDQIQIFKNGEETAFTAVGG